MMKKEDNAIAEWKIKSASAVFGDISGFKKDDKGNDKDAEVTPNL